jgi:hypothetical protein
MLEQQEKGHTPITLIGSCRSSNSIEVAKGLRDDLFPSESTKDSWRDAPIEFRQPSVKKSLTTSVGQHGVADCHINGRFDVDYLEEFEVEAKDSWRDVPNKPIQRADKDSLGSSIGQHNVAECHKNGRFDVDYLEELEVPDDCFLVVPPSSRKIRMEYNAFMGSRNLQYA